MLPSLHWEYNFEIAAPGLGLVEVVAACLVQAEDSCTSQECFACLVFLLAATSSGRSVVATAHIVLVAEAVDSHKIAEPFVVVDYFGRKDSFADSGEAVAIAGIHFQTRWIGTVALVVVVAAVVAPVVVVAALAAFAEPVVVDQVGFEDTVAAVVHQTGQAERHTD